MSPMPFARPPRLLLPVPLHHRLPVPPLRRLQLLASSSSSSSSFHYPPPRPIADHNVGSKLIGPSVILFESVLDAVNSRAIACLPPARHRSRAQSQTGHVRTYFTCGPAPTELVSHRPARRHVAHVDPASRRKGG
ncbi:hypothetical protein GUJ93_ZPchr0002g23253 [Zizania palustris]|uniref:Uncharacterized protein n=1 Tax=Zizania palustris TaxID=103762 RepID=A0A8J5VT50_ZIZPA|nr:hypothetical protein GUJ93_ZPchr0002g23253 [Zizania palustris]